MTKRLMFRSSISFAKKVPKPHRGEFAAGRLVGFVKNKQTVAFVATEKPSVTVRAAVNLRSLTAMLAPLLPRS